MKGDARKGIPMRLQCFLIRAGLVLATLLTGALPTFAARGRVAYRQSGCDYFVVKTAKGYDLLEWYGGHDPDKEDILVGAYETYGIP